MEFLHHNIDTFKDAINLVTYNTGVSPQIVEKDYYITMILSLMSQEIPYIVFKGGTSLSKCYHAIKRFSEDIDIALDNKISQGDKRKLKNTLLEIVSTLGLTINNLSDIRSRRDYNKYEIHYNSVVENTVASYASMVILETSFTTISFPTNVLPVSSYIGDMMLEEAPDLLSKFSLNSFKMKVQSLDRTFIDKVFAICDYYLQGKINRHSRHLYDIYKLLSYLQLNDDFTALVKKVRNIRKTSSICISAQEGVDVPKILSEIIEKNVYKNDYSTLTEILLEEDISYDETIEALRYIISSHSFENTDN